MSTEVENQNDVEETTETTETAPVKPKKAKSKVAKKVGVKYLMCGEAGSGKTSATKDVSADKLVYVINAETSKSYPLKYLHTDVYAYKTFNKKAKDKNGKTVVTNNLPPKALEWRGVSTFKKDIMAKLVAIKKAKGKLPDIIIIDSLTMLYNMLVKHNTATVKNVYGSLAVKIREDVEDLNMWIETTFIARGIDVVYLAHTVTDAASGLPKVSTGGSKSFLETGGLLGLVDYASFLQVEDSIRKIHHNTAEYPCRSLVPNIEAAEDVDAFNLETMLDRIHQTTVDTSDFTI